MYTRRKFLFFVFFSCLSSIVYCDENDESSLELVHAIFRHGSRTPDPYEKYPNDPYSINDFNPNIYSQLTKIGKQEAYKLGKLLHKRYGEFLKSNTVETVRAQSTDFDRTKMTLLVVLAGLFPPRDLDTFNYELHWSPIPYHYEKLGDDFTLWFPRKCPAYKNELSRLLNSSEVDQVFEEHSEDIDYIEKHSGKDMSNIKNLFVIHQRLDAEAHSNLTLPDWAQNIYPEKIKRLAAQVLMLENYNPILKRLFSGRHLKIITNNMIQKSKGILQPSNRKIFLYSGHDNNIVGPLITLNLFALEFPNYCSALFFELYRSKITNQYFVKVLHLKDVNSEPEDKIIPECDVMCPLHDFNKILQPYFPGNYTEECESRVLLE